MTSKLEFDNEEDSNEYESKAIHNSKVYTKKSDISYLSVLYYLISWKDYLENENT